MRRFLKKYIRFNMSKVSLVICEILLILVVIGSYRLYLNWNSLFGEDAWTVTQYGPRDINSSFYTIYNPKQGLIVVDGGWREDADYVRRIIRSCGGHVDAWILTHPHQDHIGAFNVIWNKKKGISIDEIYTVPMASVEDCAQAAPWDSTETYEDFLALDIPDLKYVAAGDQLNLCGLTVDILSAFDETVREKSEDFLNDGSMMFKVTGPKKTFLFCADVGKSMSKVLHSRYKEFLKSDYLQMGHHGNGGLKAGFYKEVCPETAFFDAPDWLMYDPDGNFDTPAKIELMEGMGSKVVSFNSAPNSVEI